jgi:hypothetical protein
MHELTNYRAAASGPADCERSNASMHIAHGHNIFVVFSTTAAFKMLLRSIVHA